MTKKQRAEVLAKTNGHCGYCGCILDAKWHVDHMTAIRRNTKYVREYYTHKETKKRIEEDAYYAMGWPERNEYIRRGGTWVPDGTCMYPELDCFDNYMPACASCNINKGGADVETFRYTITNGVQSMNKSHAQYRMGKRFGLIVEVDMPVVFYFETLKK